MVLTEPFRRMAGDKENLILNIQTAGQMLQDFVEHCVQRSAKEISEISSVSDVTYYNGWEDLLDGFIDVSYEAIIDDDTYESQIRIYPTGQIKVTMTIFDPEGHQTSKDEDSRSIWVITNPETIFHQIVQFMIDNPKDILGIDAVDFEAPYRELMGELEMQAAEPPPVPEPQQPAAAPVREEQPQKRSSWFPFKQ